MRAQDTVVAALAGSAFRCRFRLSTKDRAYLEAKGFASVMAHAADFVGQRLAPAEPKNDGKQTPMRGHPAFIAQHATATCCRGCLAKWHRIPEGRALTADETRYVLALIEHWLRAQIAPPSSNAI